MNVKLSKCFHMCGLQKQRGDVEQLARVLLFIKIN